MSRVALTALLAVACAGEMAAQAPASALRARIERLERALGWAEAAAHRIDSLERGQAEPTDTLIVGALHVLVPRGILPQARVAVTQIWSVLDSAFGTAAVRLSGRPFDLVMMRGSTLPPGRRSDAVLTTGTEADIRQRLLWSAANAMSVQSDSALRVWMGGALVPEHDPAREPRAVYLALVTAPSPAARRCFQRDFGACRIALGFTPVADAITDWYDAERRRLIVSEIDVLEPVQRMRGAARACVEQRQDADCVAVLRRVPATAVPAPLPALARYSLMRRALKLGGRDAYARLLAASGRPIDQRLAAAAGVPADTLLRRWHADIIAARPQPVTVDPRGAWMALAWGLAFGLVALRSSRWR